MNDLDKLLRSAWQQQRPRQDAAVLAARVRQHRLRQRLRRGAEAALTLAAIVLLVRMLSADSTAPEYWLLMPFFAAYLPTAWLLLLRAPRPQAQDTTRDVRTYAHVRLSQLRSGLRDLWATRIAAWALLTYATSATIAAFVFGDGRWQHAAVRLLAYAGVWAVVTFWLSRRRRRSGLREYRAMRRLV